MASNPLEAAHAAQGHSGGVLALKLGRGLCLASLPCCQVHDELGKLIGIAGAAFGWVRYKSGSTTAAFLMHAAYNAAGFAGYTLTHWRILN